MKKINLIALLLVAFSFFRVNAQVLIDSTGDGNYSDLGAVATLDFGSSDLSINSIIVNAGGALSITNVTWRDAIGDLIIEGGVADADNFYCFDTLWVKTGGSFTCTGDITTWTANDGNASLIKFENDAALVSVNGFNWMHSTLFINDYPGLIINNCVLNTLRNTTHNIGLGLESVTFKNIQIKEASKVEGSKLVFDGDVILDGNFNFRGQKNGSLVGIKDKLDMRLNGHNLILTSNAGFTNNDSLNAINLGGGVLSVQAQRADTLIIPVKESNLSTEIGISPNPGAVIGDTSWVNIEYLSTAPALNMGSNYLNKYYSLSYKKVDIPDFYFATQYADVDVMGDSSLLYSATLDTLAGVWTLYDAIMGSNIIVISDTIPAGYISARTVINPAVEINTGTQLRTTNLDGGFIFVDLVDSYFTDSILDNGNFTLSNTPAGVSIANVSYLAEYSAMIELAYDNTEYTADSSNVNLTVDASELDVVSNLVSNSISIAAILDPVIAPADSQSILKNTDGDKLYFIEMPGADSRNWQVSMTKGGPYSYYSAFDTITPNFSTPGNYYIILKSTYDGVDYYSNEVTIHVMSDNALLSDILSGEGTLSPAFSGSIFEYTVLLPGTATSVPTITPSAASLYAVVSQVNAATLSDTTKITVTSEDGSSENVYKVSFDKSSSIAETLSSGFKVYPIPSNDIIYIEAVHNSDFALFDIMGKLMKNGKADNLTTIYVKDLPAGIYFLKVNESIKRIIVE